MIDKRLVTIAFTLSMISANANSSILWADECILKKNCISTSSMLTQSIAFKIQSWNEVQIGEERSEGTSNYDLIDPKLLLKDRVLIMNKSGNTVKFTLNGSLITIEDNQEFLSEIKRHEKKFILMMDDSRKVHYKIKLSKKYVIFWDTDSNIYELAEVQF